MAQKENPRPADGLTLKLRLGQLASADDIRAALREAGIRVFKWGDDLLGRIPLVPASEAREIELVAVKDTDLGLTERYTTRQLLDRAVESGYGVCPPECGPLARMAYDGDKWLLVGMEPVADSDGGPDVFILYRLGDVLWLCASYDGPGNEWGPGKSWLLVRPARREP